MPFPIHLEREREPEEFESGRSVGRGSLARKWHPPLRIRGVAGASDRNALSGHGSDQSCNARRSEFVGTGGGEEVVHIQKQSKGEFMRRLLTGAAVAVALSIPASVAAVGVVSSAPAFASSSISCTSLKGTISGSITIGKCTPSGGKGYKTASAPAASLASG